MAKALRYGAQFLGALGLALCIVSSRMLDRASEMDADELDGGCDE